MTAPLRKCAHCNNGDLASSNTYTTAKTDLPVLVDALQSNQLYTIEPATKSALLFCYYLTPFHAFQSRLSARVLAQTYYISIVKPIKVSFASSSKDIACLSMIRLKDWVLNNQNVIFQLLDCIIYQPSLFQEQLCKCFNFSLNIVSTERNILDSIF